MKRSRNILWLSVISAVVLWGFFELQIQAKAPIMAPMFGGSIGPDVIVGDLQEVESYSGSAGYVGYSFGTTSCNIGDEELLWESWNPSHPVIGQNLFRVKDGRIEQLGQAWLKHGFFALSQSLCGSCSGTDGNSLGVGCSDPYSASRNGSTGSLHPKGEVNAATGVFPYGGAWPRSNPSTSNNGGRIKVLATEVNPASNPGADVYGQGTRYFIEGQYVARDDVEAGNEINSISYREVRFTSSNEMRRSNSYPTVRMLPAMHAWKAVESDVQIMNVDVPGDGRIVVGIRTVPAGKGYHTEVAIQNQTSDQSVRSLDVSCGSGTTSNPGFNDVDYHQEKVYENGSLGADYSGTDWASTPNGSNIEWATETYAQNKGANAIRWGTLYSFWFDSDERPTELTLGLFKTGVVNEIKLIRGDMNGDGEFNNFDLSAFVLALTDPEGFADQYPNVNVVFTGDFNGDGEFNNIDIAGFVGSLTGG